MPWIFTAVAGLGTLIGFGFGGLGGAALGLALGAGGGGIMQALMSSDGHGGTVFSQIWNNLFGVKSPAPDAQNQTTNGNTGPDTKGTGTNTVTPGSNVLGKDDPAKPAAPSDTASSKDSATAADPEAPTGNYLYDNFVKYIVDSLRPTGTGPNKDHNAANVAVYGTLGTGAYSALAMIGGVGARLFGFAEGNPLWGLAEPVILPFRLTRAAGNGLRQAVGLRTTAERVQRVKDLVDKLEFAKEKAEDAGKTFEPDPDTVKQLQNEWSWFKNAKRRALLNEGNYRNKAREFTKDTAAEPDPATNQPDPVTQATDPIASPPPAVPAPDPLQGVDPNIVKALNENFAGLPPKEFAALGKDLQDAVNWMRDGKGSHDKAQPSPEQQANARRLKPEDIAEVMKDYQAAKSASPDGKVGEGYLVDRLSAKGAARAPEPLPPFRSMGRVGGSRSYWISPDGKTSMAAEPVSVEGEAKVFVCKQPGQPDRFFQVADDTPREIVLQEGKTVGQALARMKATPRTVESDLAEINLTNRAAVIKGLNDTFDTHTDPAIRALRDTIPKTELQKVAQTYDQALEAAKQGPPVPEKFLTEQLDPMTKSSAPIDNGKPAPARPPATRPPTVNVGGKERRVAFLDGDGKTRNAHFNDADDDVLGQRTTSRGRRTAGRPKPRTNELNDRPPAGDGKTTDAKTPEVTTPIPADKATAPVTENSASANPAVDALPLVVNPPKPDGLNQPKPDLSSAPKPESNTPKPNAAEIGEGESTGELVEEAAAARVASGARAFGARGMAMPIIGLGMGAYSLYTGIKSGDPVHIGMGGAFTAGGAGGLGLYAAQSVTYRSLLRSGLSSEEALAKLSGLTHAGHGLGTTLGVLQVATGIYEMAAARGPGKEFDQYSGALTSFDGSINTAAAVARWSGALSEGGMLAEGGALESAGAAIEGATAGAGLPLLAITVGAQLYAGHLKEGFVTEWENIEAVSGSSSKMDEGVLEMGLRPTYFSNRPEEGHYPDLGDYKCLNSIREFLYDREVDKLRKIKGKQPTDGEINGLYDKFFTHWQPEKLRQMLDEARQDLCKEGMAICDKNGWQIANDPTHTDYNGIFPEVNPTLFPKDPFNSSTMNISRLGHGVAGRYNDYFFVSPFPGALQRTKKGQSETGLYLPWWCSLGGCAPANTLDSLNPVDPSSTIRIDDIQHLDNIAQKVLLINSALGELGGLQHVDRHSPTTSPYGFTMKHYVSDGEQTITFDEYKRRCKDAENDPKGPEQGLKSQALAGSVPDIHENENKVVLHYGHWENVSDPKDPKKSFYAISYDDRFAQAQEASLKLARAQGKLVKDQLAEQDQLDIGEQKQFGTTLGQTRDAILVFMNDAALNAAKKQNLATTLSNGIQTLASADASGSPTKTGVPELDAFIGSWIDDARAAAELKNLNDESREFETDKRKLALGEAIAMLLAAGQQDTAMRDLMKPQLKRIEDNFDQLNKLFEGKDAERIGWKQFVEARTAYQNAEKLADKMPDTEQGKMLKDSMLGAAEVQIFLTMSQMNLDQKVLAAVSAPGFTPSRNEAVKLYNMNKNTPDNSDFCYGDFRPEDIDSAKQATQLYHVMAGLKDKPPQDRLKLLSQAAKTCMDSSTEKDFTEMLDGMKIIMSTPDNIQKWAKAYVVAKYTATHAMAPNADDKQIQSEVDGLTRSPANLEQLLLENTVKVHLEALLPTLDEKKRSEMANQFAKGDEAQRKVVKAEISKARISNYLGANTDGSLVFGYLPLAVQQQLGHYLTPQEMKEQLHLEPIPGKTLNEQKNFVYAAEYACESSKLPTLLDKYFPEQHLRVQSMDADGFTLSNGKKVHGYEGFNVLATLDPRKALKYDLEQSGVKGISWDADGQYIECTYTRPPTGSWEKEESYHCRMYVTLEEDGKSFSIAAPMYQEKDGQWYNFRHESKSNVAHSFLAEGCIVACLKETVDEHRHVLYKEKEYADYIEKQAPIDLAKSSGIAEIEAKQENVLGRARLIDKGKELWLTTGVTLKPNTYNNDNKETSWELVKVIPLDKTWHTKAGDLTLDPLHLDTTLPGDSGMTMSNLLKYAERTTPVTKLIKRLPDGSEQVVNLTGDYSIGNLANKTSSSALKEIGLKVTDNISFSFIDVAQNGVGEKGAVWGLGGTQEVLPHIMTSLEGDTVGQARDLFTALKLTNEKIDLFNHEIAHTTVQPIDAAGDKIESSDDSKKSTTLPHLNTNNIPPQPAAKADKAGSNNTYILPAIAKALVGKVAYDAKALTDAKPTADAKAAADKAILDKADADKLVADKAAADAANKQAAQQAARTVTNPSTMADLDWSPSNDLPFKPGETLPGGKLAFIGQVGSAIPPVGVPGGAVPALSGAVQQKLQFQVQDPTSPSNGYILTLSGEIKNGLFYIQDTGDTNLGTARDVVHLQNLANELSDIKKNPYDPKYFTANPVMLPPLFQEPPPPQQGPSAQAPSISHDVLGRLGGLLPSYIPIPKATSAGINLKSPNDQKNC